MVVSAEARRQEGVSQLSAEYSRGSQGESNNGSAAGLDENLPNVGGGSGDLLRGVEANTNLMGSDSPPEVDIVVADERPNTADPVAFPDSSGKYAQGDGDPEWSAGSHDAVQFNSRPLKAHEGSFGAFGERYPGSDNG